ncbi:MAG: transcription elongation factor GreB [Rickettsiales bacterium]|nr:transcription elongation factor GreB [Rickettsiales bacterium]
MTHFAMISRMSKAFTREPDADDDGELPEAPEPVPAGTRNYMTPKGFASLQAEYRQLLKVERPKIVEVVAWAAGNGDRSENGDYIYGKKRLREIDRRLRYLTKRLEDAEIVDQAKQQALEQVFFGATVTYERNDGCQHIVQLVGSDEANASQGKISWLSPVARCLMKSRVGDEVTLRSPGGEEMLEILEIRYLL